LTLKQTARKLIDHLDQKVFDAIYSRALVYNTCWEDPAVDRQALQLTAQDNLLVITSAGCNALDYALQGPAVVHAVDANPRQTALLELKLAGVRTLDFEDFFLLFGQGRHSAFEELYRDVLRAGLSEFAQTFWDRNGGWFSQPDARDTFYYFGLSGVVARGFRAYLRVRPKLRDGIEAMFEARSLDEQRAIYDSRIEPLMCSYTRACCPEYLKKENFLALKAGLVDRVRAHTATVTEFLNGTQERISRFVLLDHMDWMSSYYPEALVEEWNGILTRAADDARVIFRSAHAWPAYLERVHVGRGARSVRLMEVLDFHPELAQELTRQDRVHTYAGFHIADIRS